MFSRRKLHQASKQIKEEKDFVVDSDGDAIISVKAADGENIFSSYNFDGNEKLKPELSEFIYDKAKFTRPNQDIRIKVYTNEEVKPEEVQKAIRNNFKKDYIELKNKSKRNLFFSAIMLIVGLLGMSLLLLMHKYFYNVYLEVVIEIATWVFIWEAIDSFFLRRVSIRHNRLILLKLYSAEIDVINLKGINSLSEEQKD
ncbi:MAG: hypothetical protein J6J24_00265 [Clostridia bacterium]|nr:hypothetical protein [Clostridia bacterium]